MYRVLLAVTALLLVRLAPLRADPPKPLKVFILAGQSNMEGQAVADLDGKDYNGGKGTLKYLLKDPSKAPLVKHLVDKKGGWTVRNDVWVRYRPEEGPLKAGPLTLGFTPYGGKHHFGPELQLGHVLGDYCDNQVLLIKTAWGGKSLYKDFRPPSSGGQIGPYYTRMLTEVRTALANLKREFPDYDGQGYVLAGLVWYQGWNDGCEPQRAVPQYEQNLVNLIKDVRRDLKAPSLPVVIGELTGPWVKAAGEWAALRKAQAAAPARNELGGNVLFVETHDFVRKPEDSPNPSHGHHEFGNAETYVLVGDALGKGMKKLLAPLPPKKTDEPAKPASYTVRTIKGWTVRIDDFLLIPPGDGVGRRELRFLVEQPWVILHELAHAYHDQVLGFDDPHIREAYESFKKSGRGEKALLYNGKRVRHYALTNQREFFAEMTESYFGANDFFPFNRAELKEAEPEIYPLLHDIWEAPAGAGASPPLQEQLIREGAAALVRAARQQATRVAGPSPSTALTSSEHAATPGGRRASGPRLRQGRQGSDRPLSPGISPVPVEDHQEGF